jgi:hypothetical protein
MDARAEDLGDEATSNVTQFRGKAKKPAKKSAKKPAKAVTEVVDEFEQDQKAQAREKTNTYGVAGLETVLKGFWAELKVLMNEQTDLSSRIGERCAKAHDAGIPVRVVKKLMQEAKKPEQSATTQNTENQIRQIIGLPYAPQIDDMSTYSENNADERAYRAGRLHVFNGGLEQDNPYHGDVKRGQEWLRGYREAFAECEGGSSQATMRKLNQQALKMRAQG